MQKKITVALFGVLLILAIILLWNFLKPSDPVDFSAEIKPIFNKHCISCHGGVKKNGGLSLLFEEDALGPMDSGKAAIVPGEPGASELIRRIKAHDPELRMPYEKPRLKDDEIELLSRWIDQGAPWGKHWAYTLPDKVDLPEITQEAGFLPEKDQDFLQNGIDQFVLTRLKAEGLQPNQQASREILARRLALDLTGLPPNAQLFDAWLEAELPYEGLVDSLLASETYGEKWSSWWLDLARYADTKGYEKDLGRTIWQYRDWVIRAFNKDMPYNQFTLEQLAGDLLPEPSMDQLIATAFHRNTMNNDEGGTEDEEFRVATVIDRVNTTFEVWQSTTIGCTQCHSHTYDPFRHEEYYKLMAFFNNTRDEDTPGEEPALKFYEEEDLRKVEKIKQWVAKYGSAESARKYRDFLLFNEPIYQAHTATGFKNGELSDTKWLSLWDDGSCQVKNVHTHGASSLLLNYWSNLNGTEMTIRKDHAGGEILARFRIDKTRGRIIRKIPFKPTNEELTLYFEANNDGIPKEAGTSFIVWFGFIEDLPGKGEPGYTEIDNSFLKLLNTQTPSLPIMAENPHYMGRTTQVFERGNWLLKADTVSPATPQVLNPWDPEWPKNRMGLAKWIVSTENPLTARTLVNRVWHQFFGRGMVATLEDIGSQSDPPSHPDLLDWLALRFMHEHQWSIKGLVKDIVMSGTYRQDSESSPELYERDPDNELLARGPRLRLSAEQIRDQALAVSGLLSDKMYGPGVMPPQPEGIWKSVYNSQKWVESKGEDRYRRAVYTYLKRTSPYPSFVTFDAGSREVCMVRRTVTNTPLQALVTLNDPVYLEAAHQMAVANAIPDDPDGTISRLYQKATFKKIDDQKLGVLKELYTVSLKEFRADETSVQGFLSLEAPTEPEIAALTIVANAIMNLDEFLTKS
ncbi:PSD1 and planctomycete cytochrome C domain-containing protein [Poritiphilus flavus]|uniref:DUF1553 domain-containing protein n=1 Tax=Poritiphilus flavus TaxID=2697053 RepID=A0A6L9EHW9_9FLAO|nr:PSD1 and planctomycete cytochrome C domain-containing protein [Poritiphilus flavus]NAS14387.1 DUF1553 domain-containing protein [Poritiphilus flavus]